LFLAGQTGTSSEAIDALVTMRLDRQAMFDPVGPPDTVVALDEAVLHRLIGLAHVIHDVFVHIAEMSRRPSLDSFARRW